MATEEVVCDICHNQFLTRQAYDQHLFVIYGLNDDLKTFTEHPCSSFLTCSLCGVAAKNAKGLSQHIGKVHPSRFKGVYCPTCHKKFKHKYALRFHVNQVHKQLTRVQCEQCGSHFYNKYMLRTHLLKKHGLESRAELKPRLASA